MLIAKNKKANYVYEDEPEEKNPLEGKKVVFIEDENDAVNADGVKGHLEVVGEEKYNPGFYDKYIKRGLDIFLSFGGLVVLSPITVSYTHLRAISAICERPSFPKKGESEENWISLPRR